MGKPVSLFTLTAALIVAAWWWLGAAVPMPPSPLDPGEKLYCISYAPFHGSQSPLDLSTRIEPAQIEQDLAKLSRITDCVRTYSVDFGLERVPEIARRYGLKVLLGIWVSSHADRTQYQIKTGIALATQYPDVVRAVVVGNEALLRGEVSPEALGGLIRSVKSRVPVPVTYADVWEFWLRYRQLASAVDFVTIHILPYWEDDPVPARDAADHVEAIRKRVAASFPGKEIVIGEVGWPSAGRMRRGALPSPADQARVLTDVLARGKQEHFRVNLIEAFDQPWKRALEGTVGGHWGLFDDSGARKFVWGEPVSNHPYWPWQAAGGVALAFDPRYRDFPFAPLTAAALPFLLIGLVAPRPPGVRPLAETLAAGVLALSAVFIVWNETLANWQALWFAAAAGVLVLSLLRARAAPS
jgi:glucan 1,3-beta-glucosidase